MTSLADAFYQVKYNPFKYGEYLAAFYKHLVSVDNNLLLAQLVIPLCSHPIFSKKLSHAKFGQKSRSNMWTVFEERTQLYDLQERIDSFNELTEQSIQYCLINELTEQSIQYCLINDWIEIDTRKFSIIFLYKTKPSPNFHKSAVNLGRLFSQLSVIEIYDFLGVIPR